MAKTVADALKMGKEVQMVDFRFIDLPGTWQHFSIPASTMDKELFEEGIGFDGSRSRHWSSSAMSMTPSPASRMNVIRVLSPKRRKLI